MLISKRNNKGGKGKAGKNGKLQSKRNIGKSRYRRGRKARREGRRGGLYEGKKPRRKMKVRNGVERKHCGEKGVYRLRGNSGARTSKGVEE